MRSPLALATLAAGLALPAGIASASTVSVPATPGPAVFQGGTLASDLTTRLEPVLGLQLEDFAQTLTPGAGCVAGPPVACAGTTSQDIRFGNRADAFRGYSRGPITITAGGGRDSIRAAGEWNSIYAGDGADSVWENGNSLGSVNGEGGDDKLYTFESPARLHGGTGNDLLVTGAFNWGHQLTGDEGADKLVALASGSGSGIASGGDGADVIVIDTSAGGYTADGGAGNDTLSGGPDADAISGGAGKDTIDVTGDGVADTVECGTEVDTVYADPEDSVAADCERVRRTAPVLAAVATARADAAAFVAAIPAIPAF
jgi:Ca2+-binding RTX toxin-like protein